MMEVDLGEAPSLPGAVLFEESLDPFVVVLRGIDCTQDILVALDEGLIVHLGDEVECAVHLVARETLQEAVLPFQALIEPGAWWCIEQTDHSRDNSALLDKVDLTSEN